METPDTSTWPNCHQHTIAENCRAVVAAGVSLLANAQADELYDRRRVVDAAVECALHPEDDDESDEWLAVIDVPAETLRRMVAKAAARDDTGMVFRHPLASAAVLAAAAFGADAFHIGEVRQHCVAAHQAAHIILGMDPAGAGNILPAILTDASRRDLEQAMMAANAPLN